MSDHVALEVREVLAAAAVALSSAFGQLAKLEDPQPLSDGSRRNLIVRAIVHCGDKKRSVIIKATRSSDYDPTAENAFETSGLVREWVATAYLAGQVVARGHGARFLAGDIPRGMLVFDDLGSDLGSLVDPLLNGNAEEAERALASYAKALARLHSDTAQCLDAHHEVFRSIFGPKLQLRPPGWRVDKQAAHVVERIGGNPPAEELAALSDRLAEPGPWAALIHGDPCPDNALIVRDAVCLIDYEFARPSHALLDGVYWRIGFPTCWCAGRVPPEVAARVDAVYRMELGRSLPMALDDRVYRTELAHMTAIWMFTCMAWRLDEALKGDSRWGTWSIRGRLLWYLEAVADVTAETGILPGLNATAKLWLAELRGRWPDTKPLGLYPAFAERTV